MRSACSQERCYHAIHNKILSMSEAVMAQVIVRELEEVVKQGLKRRAARHGNSMEE